MKIIQRLAVARQATLSILGSLGSGASGGVVGNNLAQTNAAPIAPSTTPHWDSSSFTPRGSRVLVIATMTASKNGGTLAAGDGVTFSLIRDVGGTPVTVGGTERAAAATVTGGDVVANATLAFIDTVTPSAAHTYSIEAAPSGGHTAGILTGEASIVVIDL